MKKGIFFILIAVLLSCSQGTPELKVLALSPNASSSTPYTCGEFEKFWAMENDSSTIVDTLRLSHDTSTRVYQLVNQANYKELIGGFFPVFKFQLDKAEYCVGLFGSVMKNDSLIATSKELYELLESQDKAQRVNR